MKWGRPGWLTLGIVLYFCTAYWDTASPSVAGCIVLGLIVCLLSIAAAEFLYRQFGVGIEKKAGIFCSALPAAWALIVFASPDAGYSMIFPVLCAFGMIGCAGYSGFRQAKSKDIRLSVLLVSFSLAIVAIYGLRYLGHYSPDSFFNYKIAQSFASDPGRVSLVRQYVVQTDYNISFPYLYPLLMYLADCATSLERYAGVLVNLIAMMLTGWLLLKSSKRWANAVWPGAMALFILSMNAEYLEEVFAIRSIPVSLLLSFAAVYLCVSLYSDGVHQDERQKTGTLRALGLSAAMGCLAGAGTVVRFDGLALLGFLGLVNIVISKNRRIPAASAYIAASLLFMVPWMIYSHGINGSFWISDNAGTLFLVDPSIPNRIDLGDAPTLFSAPGDWILALFKKTGRILLSLLICSPAAILVAIACAVGCRRRHIEWSKPEIRIVAVVLMYLALKTGMYILVGYKDIRYHVETTVMLAVLLMIVFARHDSAPSDAEENHIVLLGFSGPRLAMGAVVILFSLWTFGKCMVGFVKNPLYHAIHEGTVEPVQIRDLDEALHNHGIDNDTGLLVMGQGHEYSGHYFGGWTNRRVFVEPVDLTVEKLNVLLGRYPDISYIVLHRSSKFPDVILEHLNRTYDKQSVGEVDVYDLKRESGRG